jgi:hypothetical protein
MATGVINPKRASFPANVIGLVIKPLVFGDDKPMRRNSASSPEPFSADPTQCDFERERTQLIATIESFVAAPITHILYLARSNRSSGRFSCTNTSTITSEGSASRVQLATIQHRWVPAVGFVSYRAVRTAVKSFVTPSERRPAAGSGAGEANNKRPIVLIGSMTCLTMLRPLLRKLLIYMEYLVGTAGFEPTTSTV